MPTKYLKCVLIMLSLLLCGLYPAAAGGDDDPNMNAQIMLSAKDGWLGVMIRDVTPELVKSKDLKVNEGAYVIEVIEDSPADSAGVKEGDVIIEFDGVKISGADDLIKAVKKTDTGKKASVVVMRGSEKKTLPVSIGKGALKERMIIKKLTIPQPLRGIQKEIFIGATGVYGLTLMTLNEQLAEYFGAPDKTGVLVEKVRKDSKAEKAGFKAGDVIIKAGKKTIKKVKDFRNVLGAYDKGEMIPVEILRKGAKKTLTLEAGDGCMDEGGLFRFHQFPYKYNFKYHGDKDEFPGEDFDLDLDMENLKLRLNDLKIDLKNMTDELKEKIIIEKEELRKKIKTESKDI